MSYPKDLDSYTEEELELELRRRESLRAKGLCDYCGRTPQETPCRYSSRHHRKFFEDEELMVEIAEKVAKKPGSFLKVMQGPRAYLEDEE